jgi:signal transduction histidine kinase
MRQTKKKITIHRRILVTFTAVLFVSFLLTGVMFNVTMSIIENMDDNTTVLGRAVPQRANLVLVVLISAIFTIAVGATYVLSNSITRPIEKLRNFAMGIGKGEFVTNDYDFREQELEDLNNALNTSISRLGVYDNEQKTFFQNASHELRTPLMSIKCYAEGILYEVMEPKSASETILKETDKLTDLVTDLLYIARIDNISTAYKKEIIDLVELLKERTQELSAVAEKGQIQFIHNSKGEHVYYECIPDLLTRGIDNVLSNALRYAKSRITLSCNEQENHIVITIFDDGSGIEPDVLPHVFERFYKGKNGLTGVGLSIVKSIMEQHKGSVSAKNNELGGAEFRIILPITGEL